MRAVVRSGNTKIECRFENFKCLVRKFNLSSDWLWNVECRFANFQRPTLQIYLEV